MKKRAPQKRKQQPMKVAVRNPRYKGTTPEMVGKALLRFRVDEPEEDDEDRDAQD